MKSVHQRYNKQHIARHVHLSHRSRAGIKNKSNWIFGGRQSGNRRRPSFSTSSFALLLAVYTHNPIFVIYLSIIFHLINRKKYVFKLYRKIDDFGWRRALQPVCDTYKASTTDQNFSQITKMWREDTPTIHPNVFLLLARTFILETQAFTSK